MNFCATRSFRNWSRALLAVAIFALGSASLLVADPKGPQTTDRYVTKEVIKDLIELHLTQHPLDAEISQRMLALYLKTLDPRKMYFYKSDVDAFTQRQGEMVEKARRGDVGPGYTIFAVYLQRIDERVRLVEELLQQPPDFTIQEDIVTDPKLLDYPATPADAREAWRKLLKLEMLTLKADNEEAAKKVGPDGQPKKSAAKSDNRTPQERLLKRYQGLAKRMHQTHNDDLLEMYLNSLTMALDPHSNYMSPSSVENFEIMMKCELEGIGASLQWVDGYTVVKQIVPGGAADKLSQQKKDACLKVEDKIVAVAQGHEGEMVDVVDMQLNDVVKMIRGKKGTIVRLEIIPSDSPQRKVVEIVREKIELKDSEAQAKVFEMGHKPDGSPLKIGVIDLPSFYMDMSGARLGILDYRSTTRDVRKILDDFNAQNVDALVLDLRRNGGGSLTEAINLTGLFIETGAVVQVKGPGGPAQPYSDTDPSVSWTKPMVVMISKFSASASEILAGAIQDYHRGLIVGDHTTHGKGTVQTMLDLGQEMFHVPNTPNYGSLKITVQQFYRPSGDSTQHRGVLADIELPSVTTHLDVGEADLEYSLPFDHVPATRYPVFPLVDPPLVKQLADLSAGRVARSSDFQKVLRGIARYEEQKKKKRITLNEKEFLELNKDVDAEKEEEKMINPGTEAKGIQRNFYLDEVMNIAVDYVGLLAQGGVGPQLAGPKAAAAPQ